ncbi:hypothetical protein [Caballeronia grimmiae]|uniref:hypothetical protein n=1 Tax=Caballeronia grimmiae TaxID=1071679 RepID=UPI0038BB50CB
MGERFDDWTAESSAIKPKLESDGNPSDSLECEGFQEDAALADTTDEKSEAAAGADLGDEADRAHDTTAGADGDSVANQSGDSDASSHDRSLAAFLDALDKVVLNALGAAGSADFVRRLADGANRLSRSLHGTGASSSSPPVDRDAFRSARRSLFLLQCVRNAQLDQHEVFARLAAQLAHEAARPASDAALRLLAAVAAHVVARYLPRPLTRAQRRELLDASLDAAFILRHAHGGRALRAVLPLARKTQRSGAASSRLARALRRGAQRTVVQPDLPRHLVPATIDTQWPAGRHGGANAVLPRRIRLQGPVEITIFSR